MLNKSANRARDLFLLGLFLCIAAAFISPTTQAQFGLSRFDFVGSQFFTAICALVIFSLSYQLLVLDGIAEFRLRKPGAAALVFVASALSVAYSLVISVCHLIGVGLIEPDYWWQTLALLTALLLARCIESLAIDAAANALIHLETVLPDVVEKVVAGKSQFVDIEEINVGDRVLVRWGETVPVDGVVVSGQAVFDDKLLTGEASSKLLSKGDVVYAGCVNDSEETEHFGVTIEATAVGAETVFARAAQLVRDAKDSKSREQLAADRVSGWLFYLVGVIGVATAVFWLAHGSNSLEFVINQIISVFAIASVQGVALAIPLACIYAAVRAATTGIVIRRWQGFERAAKLDMLLINKSGVLSQNLRKVTAIKLAETATIRDEDRALTIAASAEGVSEHELAKALLTAAERKDLKLKTAKDFQLASANSVSAIIDGNEVLVGSPRVLLAKNVTLHVTDLIWADNATSAGFSVLCLVINNNLEAMFKVGDIMTASAGSAVFNLQLLRLRLAVVTGDAAGVAKHIADSLGIKESFAELSGNQKAALVKHLQADASKVGLVGNATDEAEALAASDVSFAIGVAAEVETGSVDIALVSNDLSAVVRAIKLSRRLRGASMLNLGFAAGFNALGLLVAAGAFADLGLVVSPWAAAVLMSLSMLIVSINSQRLRKQQ
jgi:Cu2+-exporting ATPase